MTTQTADNVQRRAFRIAALVAVAMMVASGLAYRAVADLLANWTALAPFPRGTLAELPLRIGEWVGRDDPLDERVVEVVDADDHVSRVYAKGRGEAVSLFIALRRTDIAYGVPARELMPHRPEVCYPAHGWSPDGTHTGQVVAVDGSDVPVRILRFHRREVDIERVTVLTYCIVDGRRADHPAHLRPSGLRPKGNVRYVAQLEISSGGIVFGLSAEGLIRDFASESAPVIMSLISAAVERAHARSKGSGDAPVGG